MRAFTHELTRRFDVLESEQGHGFEEQEGGEGTSTELLGNGGSKRRRTGATSTLDAGEGTSYGYDPYDDTSTYTQGAADATRNEKRGEYDAAHNTAAQGVYWPWLEGQQQVIGSSNKGMVSPMALVTAYVTGKNELR